MTPPEEELSSFRRVYVTIPTAPRAGLTSGPEMGLQQSYGKGNKTTIHLTSQERAGRSKSTFVSSEPHPQGQEITRVCAFARLVPPPACSSLIAL